MNGTSVVRFPASRLAEGIRQLRALLAPLGRTVAAVPLGCLSVLPPAS